MLEITEKNGEKNLIYIYDPAGELYGNSEDVRMRHRYFADTDGILFLVDPFSLRQIQTDHHERIEKYSSVIKPSSESPLDVYDRFISTLQRFVPNANVRKKIPIAIVITKIDALKFITRSTFATKNRAWLVDNGAGNFVRSVEKEFNRVLYSRCSSFGHLPKGNMPFKPVKVLSAIHWLLNKKQVQIKDRSKQTIGWKNEKIAYALSISIVSILFFIITSLAFGLVRNNIDFGSITGNIFRKASQTTTPMNNTSSQRKEVWNQGVVPEACICSSVYNRVPRNVTNNFKSYQKTVCCWANIVNYNGRFIQHDYYCDNKYVQTIKLNIRNTERFRTWSEKTVWPGNWKVYILDNKGHLIKKLEFTVG